MATNLRKIAIVTDMEAPQSQAVTYKENLEANAIRYLETAYPWLPSSYSLEFLGVDKDKGFSTGIATLPLGEDGQVLQFPLVFSEGAFLDVPSFYDPAAQNYFPFKEEWLTLVSKNALSSTQEGELTSKTNPVEGDTYAYDNNELEALSDVVMGGNYGAPKYSGLNSVVGLLAQFPTSSLKKMLKTASEKHPELLKTALAAYNLKKVNTNSKIAKRKSPKAQVKEAGVKDPCLLKPNPLFFKQAQVLDVAPNDAVELGVDKALVTETLEKEPYKAIDKDVLEFSIMNTDKSFPESSEIITSSQLENKIDNLRAGKTLALKDSITSHIKVFTRPIHWSDPSTEPEGYPGRTSSSRGNKAQTSSINEITKEDSSERLYGKPDREHLVDFYGYSRRTKLLGELFCKDLTLSYIKEYIKVLFGEFQTSKFYECWSLDVTLPVNVSGTLRSIMIPTRGFQIQLNNLKNGFQKLSFVRGDSSDDDKHVIPDEVFISFLIDNETDKVTKIKLPKQEKILVSSGSDFKVLDLDSIDTPITTEMSYKVNFKKDSPFGKVDLFLSSPSSQVLDRELGLASDLIKIVTRGLPLTITRADTTTPSSYSLEFLDSPKIKAGLAKKSAFEIAQVLSSVGLSTSNINELIKTANQTGTVTGTVAPPAQPGVDMQPLMSMFETQMKMMFEFMSNKLDSINKGIEDKDSILLKQIEMLETKMESVDDLKAMLEESTQAIGEMQAAPAPAPETAPVEQATDEAQPTIDDQTAELLAQAVMDPAVAEQNGIEDSVVQALQQAIDTEDMTPALEIGLTEPDMFMIGQHYVSMQEQATAVENAPNGDPAMPQTMGESMAPAEEGAPTDPEVAQMAEALAQAMVDPAFAEQQGITQEDIGFARQVVDNPDQAAQNGEDPAMIQALLDAYARVSQEQTMEGAQQATQGVSQGMPMEASEEAAPVAQNMEDAGMSSEATIARDMSMLKDLLPKVKSSKLFFKYTGKFKEMLSILGELLFSLEIQSAKYKQTLGDKAYEDTLYLLQNLYGEFGDFVLNMYSIEKN